MRKFSLILILLIALSVPVVPSSAQGVVTFERMHIDIWPEYDRPDVLVIYRIQLSPQVSVPAQVSLRLPREVGAPYNLAWQDMDGLLYNLSYSSEVQGDWIKVTFTAPSASIQLEYYDPRLERDGEQRRFQYSWTGDYSVGAMSVSILQPLNASGMQIFPSFGNGLAREDGLVVFTNTIGEVSAGTTFRVTMRYNKPDDELSVGLQPVQPVQPLDGTAPGRVGIGSTLPWALAAFGVILLVAGLAAFLVNRQQLFPGRKPRKRHKSTPEIVEKIESSGEETYCHQCGRRAARGDLFCRTCGTRLRTGES